MERIKIMIMVGLTGNFGMGKSTVARIFRELGAFTLDTDEIVKNLLCQTEVIEEIKKAFGDDLVNDNTVDKKLLSEIVFNHPHLRISLEDILHPRIFKGIEYEVYKIKAAGKENIIIIEAPVIFERGYQNRFDIIITVFTSVDVAIERLRNKGINEEEARKRLASQFPIDMKVSKSDYSIDNSKTVEYTKEQVIEIYQRLLSMEKMNRNN